MLEHRRFRLRCRRFQQAESMGERGRHDDEAEHDTAPKKATAPGIGVVIVYRHENPMTALRCRWGWRCISTKAIFQTLQQLEGQSSDGSTLQNRRTGASRP